MSSPSLALRGDRVEVDHPGLSPVARFGRGIFQLLVSVRFAVLQIVLIAIAGVLGIIIRQLPGFAFRSQALYTAEMEKVRARYEPVIGEGLVDLFERLGLFRVFSAPWFAALLALLAVSITLCTLNRTPRLWRQVRDVRVYQSDSFFDPALSDRAALRGVPADVLDSVLRRHRFRLRSDATPEARYVYGDRNQYTKLATLLTHLGLILFVVAAAVSSAFGYETGLALTEGQAVPVLPVGTSDNLLVKNEGFEAPRRPDGSFADFTTDLVVYRDGAEIARKTIRVNDPLAVAGFTFHENSFGPAVSLVIRDGQGGLLWDGPILMDDAVAGRPYGRFTVPGRDIALEMVLDGGGSTGQPAGLALVGLRQTGLDASGRPVAEPAFAAPLLFKPGDTILEPVSGLSLTWSETGAFALIVARHDPGQGLAFSAAVFLLIGLIITFFLPRRRVWVRLDRFGELQIVGRYDRYVDFEGEFGRLLDDLVGARARPAAPAAQ